MKRVMKLKAKLPREEIEIIVRIKGDYLDAWSQRDEAEKRINHFINKIVSEVLLPDLINIKDIKIRS